MRRLTQVMAGRDPAIHILQEPSPEMAMSGTESGTTIA